MHYVKLHQLSKHAISSLNIRPVATLTADKYLRRHLTRANQNVRKMLLSVKEIIKLRRPIDDILLISSQSISGEKLYEITCFH